ncbi:MAG TPA: nucleotidyltransferase family protein [Paracoccaceae bacterium]|nr:nucleotidyltransferase family protein [Paracoccaceae bacterium]
MIGAAMIFTAGFGTRMGRLTFDRPKPLLEVAGRALIDHALDRVAAAGIPRAVLNLHYRGDLIRAHLSGRDRPELQFSEEQPEILETGGGLKAALPLLGKGPVLTLNPDAVWAGADPLAALRTAWEPGRMEALLCLVPREAALGHPGRGDFFLAPDGRLSRRGAASNAPYVYAGAQILGTERIRDHPATIFSLNRVWDGMLAEGRLFGIVHRGAWVDVGTSEGLGLAEALMRTRT